MGIFGGLDVRIDPWDVDYGSEIPIREESEEPSEDVSLDVEVPSAAWQPIRPLPAEEPGRLVFIDGVRRIDARLVVRREDRICHGAFGSYAVGCVSVADSVAEFGEVRLDRLAIIGSGLILPAPVPVMPALSYRPISTASPEADGPLQKLQEEMRACEERLARDLSDDLATTVIADGPLTFAEAMRGAAIGYIKRIFKLYVPPWGLALLARLEPGTRTPLFALRSTRRFARFSWFVRLAPYYAGDSDLAGIARLEVSDAVGLERARRLADATARTLPRFAPSRGRDPRSPQNLLPIGALEGQLRRRLGDGRLIRRHVQSIVAMEISHA